MNTENKSFDPKQYVQYSEPASGGGCGMGCWAIGCTGVLCMVLAICGGGFYGVFYSSLPLKMIESAIESEGEIEIEGLQGSLLSGFTADELKFRTVDDKWSTLEDIRFKYSGGSSLFYSDRLIIEDISVNGGTIYAAWDEGTNEWSIDPEFGEMEDFEEIRNAQIREIRVDLVRVANLKIVNVNTEAEITLDEIKFSGFQWEDGELVDLGEFLVQSNQMELVTVESTEFPGQAHAKRFVGTINQQVDPRLLADVPFTYDFFMDDDLNTGTVATAFDGKIKMTVSGDEMVYSLNDFSPADYFAPSSGQVLASNLNLSLIDKDITDGDDTFQLTQAGKLSLGRTQFELDPATETNERDATVVLGAASVDGKPVDLRLTIANPFSMSWRTHLASDEFASPNDVWAETVFGSAHEDLEHEKQIAVIASVVAGEDPVVNEVTSEDFSNSEMPEEEVESEIEEKEVDESAVEAEQEGNAEAPFPLDEGN